MNLQGLVALGAIVKQDFVKKSVVWFAGDEDRKKTKHEFDIYVKRFASAADFEFIYANSKNAEVQMARRVCRMVRLGDEAVEVIDYKTAAQMDPSLLLVFCKAINEVEEENKLVDEENSEPNAEGDAEKN